MKKYFLMTTAAVAAATIGACEQKAATKTTTTGRTTTTSPGTTTPAPDKNADNTARNERDRGGGTITPPDQSEKAADRNITTDIRRAITDDKNMSVNARNVKIVTIDGVVTLRGPVNTQQEKDAIQALAEKSAGVTKVVNELEVKAP